MASEPKWVNFILDIIGVNLLRLGDFQISYELYWKNFMNQYSVKIKIYFFYKRKYEFYKK